jgi:dienelactone hydrolase
MRELIRLVVVTWTVLVGCGGPTPPTGSGGGSGGGGMEPADAGPQDAGAMDAGAMDAGAMDAGAMDAGAMDGGVDAGCLSVACVAVRPEDDGAFTVRTFSQALSVPGGLTGRTVNLSVFVPNGVTGAPVVVLQPGFLIDGAQYTSYARHLATRGTVAVIADMPDALLGGPTHVELATYFGLVLDWVAAAAPAGQALDGAADPTKVVVGGHSMGGKIALLLASRDPRPRGVFAIDPVDAAGNPLSNPADYPSVTPERMGDIHVPLALVGETVNATCTGAFCQACAPAAENFQQYATHATSPAVEIEIVGANHMSFLDNPNCGVTCSVCPPGTDTPSETRRRTRRYLSAFVDLVLRGDASARAWLAGHFMDEDVADGGVRVRTFNGF